MKGMDVKYVGILGLVVSSYLSITSIFRQAAIIVTPILRVMPNPPPPADIRLTAALYA
ncbi:hypothetical protein M405DRAFT_830298 [Rhizopogon salebrosus TDB-379]|nr:hypothetical protein M405DRAFT_830298 [Rhizopogon salebrosus TDB-379]